MSNFDDEYEEENRRLKADNEKLCDEISALNYKTDSMQEAVELVEKIKNEFTLTDKHSGSYLWSPTSMYDLVVNELLTTKEGTS